MEYLLELRETHRYANTRVAQNKVIVVGDIVLVYESSLPRTFWRLAKVEKLIKGTDGDIIWLAKSYNTSKRNDASLQCTAMTQL